MQDSSRESEHLRERMHGWFQEALERAGRPYVEVGGDPDRRLAAAVELVDPLLRFPPL